MLRRQVTERNEEIDLRAHIPSLSQIKDKTYLLNNSMRKPVSKMDTDR